MKLLKILFILLFCSSSLQLIAQGPGRPDRGGVREDIESMKIAYLTKKLELSPDEAKKFWPVYNQYSDELKNIKNSRRKSIRDAKEDLDNLSDAELEKIVDGDIIKRQQELDIIKKYNSQFKQVLPIKKVAALYRAEEDFKKELLEKIKERRAARR